MEKWELITKMVGEANDIDLRLDDKFEIWGQSFHPYVFTRVGLFNKDGDEVSMHLSKLINGTYKIKKIPRKPKVGEKVYMPSLRQERLYHSFHWYEDESNRRDFENGIVRFTPEEAMELANEMIDLAKSKK